MSSFVAGISPASVNSVAAETPGMSMRRSAEMSSVSPSGTSVTFAPPGAAAGESGPLGNLGSGLVDRLKAFEQTRSAQRSAMSGMGGGPANPVDLAKTELLSGPASVRPTAGPEIAPAGGSGVDQAMNAMTRSFDYAIETQLIVKTGSQLSTTASSLMRGQ